jgi:murein DD-endopeptidase MepM/ murein hydrolase activator NlpD
MPTWLRRGLNLCVLAALILLGFRFQRDLNAERVMRENDRLHRNLEEALADVNHLRLSVDSLHALDREIRQLAKLEPIPDEVRRMGVGGALYESAMPGIGLQGLAELTQLEREAQLLQASLSRAKEMVLIQADRMRRMPSSLPVAFGQRTSGFGYREDPFNGDWRMHEGVDFEAPVGTPVLAPADGVVVQTGRDSGFGIVVRVDHGYGIETLFGHLSRVRVEVGELVRRGDRLGDVGNTGRSTAAHLHYEVHRGGRPVDPDSYLMTELAELQ